jgi:hypothetical protein
MSKRLLTIITAVLMLTVFSIGQAQEPPSGESVLILTEDQINAEFTIPSTATRMISNLQVDVQEDGVHISFDMTVTRDGTSNTLSIIAILIGLYQPEQQQMIWSSSDLLVSQVRATGTQRRELANLIGSAWRIYMGDVAEANGLSLNFTKITYLTTSFAIDIGTSEN